MKLRFLKLMLLLFILPLQMLAAELGEAGKLLAALPGVSDVETLKSTHFPEKYVFFIKQQLDAKDASKGSFEQRVILCHRGFDRPTVLVTEGYNANYALREGYIEELSKLFDTNIITVEYRYFDKSMPSPCNWDYLTVENSLYDLHHVNQTLHAMYKGKWIATGISKGGQTTLLYRTFYPDDVDISVPYVAPLCYGAEDGRHEPFLRKVSTPEDRKRIEDFQLEVLKRKAALLPRFEKYCDEKGLKFRAPVEEIYDYCVLEYSFALWQWGTPVSSIPATTASDDEIFAHLLDISNPDYFIADSPTASFFVQAARELGYYGYDTKPFKKYLSIQSSKDYLHRLMLPEELKDMPFDKTLSKKITKFLKENDPKMIFIYGQNDPWTAAGVTWLKGKKNIHVFVEPGGSHRARIGTLPEEEKKQVMELINEWLKQ